MEVLQLSKNESYLYELIIRLQNDVNSLKCERVKLLDTLNVMCDTLICLIDSERKLLENDGV